MRVLPKLFENNRVLHLAVEALNVKHLIVCVHYGCGALFEVRHSRAGGQVLCRPLDN